MDKEQLVIRFESIANQVVEFQNLCEHFAEAEPGTLDEISEAAIDCLRDMHVESTDTCPCCLEKVQHEEAEEAMYVSSVVIRYHKENKQIQATCFMDGEMFGLSDWIDVTDDTLMLEGTTSALRDLADKFELRAKLAEK